VFERIVQMLERIVQMFERIAQMLERIVQMFERIVQMFERIVQVLERWTVISVIHRTSTLIDDIDRINRKIYQLKRCTIHTCTCYTLFNIRSAITVATDFVR
jgi:uncharacterized protein Yka (UPF0111/DUF47 family)